MNTVAKYLNHNHNFMKTPVVVLIANMTFHLYNNKLVKLTIAVGVAVIVIMHN